MTAERGARQKQNARRSTRSAWSQFLAEQVNKPVTTKPRGCTGKEDGEWFQVGGLWEGFEEYENCGECDWCDEND